MALINLQETIGGPGNLTTENMYLAIVVSLWSAFALVTLCSTKFCF